jgi:putative protein kinase ArgK-like GTPase of G3E family
VTATLAERVLAGDPRAIARAISLIEDEDRAGADLIRAIFGRTGRAYVIGVTGPPGAGKSTLVTQLAKEYRARGERVAVVAVDPTSPFSGGALLGDRVRMRARVRRGRLHPIDGDSRLARRHCRRDHRHDHAARCRWQRDRISRDHRRRSG